jgi:arabinose-5-phosphate isomerase
MEITSKKLGMTLVLDDTGSMSGIITDGDIRRALSQTTDIARLSVQQVMTTSPKQITPDALAVSALRVMEDHAIMVLVCMDADGKPVGAVHMHDILKNGIS